MTAARVHELQRAAISRGAGALYYDFGWVCSVCGAAFVEEGEQELQLVREPTFRSVPCAEPLTPDPAPV